jgi:hypothetical protein
MWKYFRLWTSTFQNELAGLSLFIKTGEISIIDATVIEAHQTRPRKNKAGENTHKPRGRLQH